MAIPRPVAERIRNDFPEAARAKAESILATYGTEAHHRETERVLLDALKLAHGDVERLAELVEIARRDYRDILLMAEYPEEGALDTPERRRAFSGMLERFGAGWRLPE